MKVTIDTKKKEITLSGDATMNELYDFFEDSLGGRFNDYRITFKGSSLVNKLGNSRNGGFEPDRSPLGRDPYTYNYVDESGLTTAGYVDINDPVLSLNTTLSDGSTLVTSGSPELTSITLPAGTNVSSFFITTGDGQL